MCYSIINFFHWLAHQRTNHPFGGGIPTRSLARRWGIAFMVGVRGVRICESCSQLHSNYCAIETRTSWFPILANRPQRWPGRLTWAMALCFRSVLDGWVDGLLGRWVGGWEGGQSSFDKVYWWFRRCSNVRGPGIKSSPKYVFFTCIHESVQLLVPVGPPVRSMSHIYMMFAPTPLAYTVSSDRAPKNWK